MGRQRRRWPRRVYGVGEEPDPRFSLANERTFLAWLRTAMALTAGGVGLDVLAPQKTSYLVLAVGLVLTGMAMSVFGLSRWMAAERALRTGSPLPALSAGALLVGVTLLFGLFIVVVLVTNR
ncbi:putative membrane protein [Actinoalloteichus hoggarensis]|uniref:YidH family protein n=1 Tax=Actinoalloteichus hoggarensis TaxID=1470176 RepID=UPI0017A391A9|nr:DUF202 domain-containing protein [Actinoalloteichus hoggarensis]MBB5923152.1 putative membrane protein [Actinoalloteichus hoggarensis]